MSFISDILSQLINCFQRDNSNKQNKLNKYDPNLTVLERRNKPKSGPSIADDDLGFRY